jgi:hypothetical protein
MKICTDLKCDIRRQPVCYEGACPFDTDKMEKIKMLGDSNVAAADDEQKWVTITKIIVPTEYDKTELLRAFRYLHDQRTIDTDYMGVNTVVHMYRMAELIEVSDDRKFREALP